MDTKQKIVQELDRRLDTLKQHQKEEITNTGNQYETLNQALSKVIGAPLIGELESLKKYVNEIE